MTPRKKPAAALPRRWASIADTAAYYSLSTDTVKRRIADGSIKAYRLPGGDAIRIDLNEVDASMRPVPSAVGR